MDKSKFQHYRQLIFLGCILLGAILVYLILSQPKRPYLTVIGHVKMADGIGRQSVDVISMLRGSVEMGFCSTRVSDFADVPEEILPLIKRSNERLGRVVLYESALPTPNGKIYRLVSQFLHGHKHTDQIRIAYSMCESSSLPPLWVEVLNDYFDAVVVPDTSLVEVYEGSGVRIPVFVLPLSVDLDPYLKVPLKSACHKPFCFVNLSAMIGRKNHEGLIMAFHQAFGNDPQVQLLMNYRYSMGDALAEVTDLLKKLDCRNITLTNELLNGEDYLRFLQRGDVFVTLSKGEGFSLQPREAFALGMPVILSDNMAHTGIVESGLAVGVSCPTREPCYDVFKKCICGMEYVADVHEAAKKMREMRLHYEKHIQLAAERRKWVSMYGRENLKPLYLSLVKPQRVALGDCNEITSEGIVTRSLELYKKYTQLIKD